MRRRYFLLVCFVLLCGCDKSLEVSGPQPYETIMQDPQAYFVHQDAGLCGATSLYMMFKFLGDHREGFAPANVDLVEDLPNADYSELTEDSKMWQHVDGTNWSALKDAMTSLQDADGNPFYEVFESQDDPSDYNSVGDEERFKILQQSMLPFLCKDAPALIHLKRQWPYSGHYLVVVGYDPAAKEIVYLDPNDPDFDPNEKDLSGADWSRVLRRVGVEAFIQEKWYVGDHLYDARWDGKWLGFRHKDS